MLLYYLAYPCRQRHSQGIHRRTSGSPVCPDHIRRNRCTCSPRDSSRIRPKS
ncbi:hypothetical protein I314_01139 [Cryptococcus bacillisporus CA1873]|uniref:Uncharacterized protein n=1 Tax=Cryptococcus bacillisporus CA1873 TaxID=1296111 RepID=A0ABR5BHR4_CRYGA|nr:hypothetical protein I314_01139 [Cryptococcus bacillisporus CA1873]|eukprot:KIR68716.1 hypothetical protein I314_01139 [Cryptococcus gattii CA1873]